MIQLGLHFMHGVSLGPETARLEKLAKLVTDPRWGVAFKLINIGHVPLKPLEPLFSGRIPAKELPAAAERTMLGENVDRVTFSVSRKEALDSADFYVKTGRFMNEPSCGNMKWTFTDEDAAAAWISMMHELVETVGAAHAVLVAASNNRLLAIEMWLANTVLDGKQLHPRHEEITSYSLGREHLGDKYLRAPRWGTYLSPRHLDAIGGRAKVVADVEPAVVREVGALTYFQLTERVRDALSPTAEAKRAKFEALVEPFLPPLPR